MAEFKGPILAALLTLLAPFAKAGELQPCPFDLREAIELAETQLDDMYASRMLDLESGIGTVPSRLGAEIRKYLEHAQEPGDTSSNALVAYFSREPEICALLVRTRQDGDSEQPADFVLLPKTSHEIAALIDRNVAGLLASGPKDTRAPVRREPSSRAALPLESDSSTGSRSAQDLLGEIAAALFPEGHFDALDGQVVNLSIVPAMNIGNVPFSALDLDRDGKPLLDYTVINIETSLKGVLDQTIFGWSPGFTSPLVAGDPDASADLDWVFPRLPGAENEAREVAGLLGVGPVIGEAASKQALLKSMPQADYIHVAAHGLSDLERPLDNGFLALTGGRLTAREIQGLSLANRPLVVLSACQTALGSPVDAGIIGVSRAFLLAGASNVISSLWNVDDEATSTIMVDFVRNLERVSPPQALRMAQMEARKTWPDERIWAAFIVFGGRIVSNP